MIIIMKNNDCTTTTVIEIIITNRIAKTLIFIKDTDNDITNDTACNINTCPVAGEFSQKEQWDKQNKTLTCPAP